MRLTLDVRTVAPLTTPELRDAVGGRARDTENMSVCFRQCCVSAYCGGSSGC